MVPLAFSLLTLTYLLLHKDELFIMMSLQVCPHGVCAALFAANYLILFILLPEDFTDLEINKFWMGHCVGV